MQSDPFNIAELDAQSQELEAEIAQATDKDAALQLAVRAAELAMRCLQLASSSDQKAAVSKRCKLLLEQAEEIKNDPHWQPFKPIRQQSSSACLPLVKKLNDPISARKFTTSEKIVLLKASKLNDYIFPQWEGPPDPSYFEIKPDQKPFLDAPELGLSEFQRSIFKGWKRASEALPPPAWYPDASPTMVPSMDPTSETDLVQDAATDCSVVASLCADSARASRGYARIIPSKIYPCDASSGLPQSSPNGKYVVQLNLNGCWRKVEIDDRLPVSRTQRTIHVIDRRNPALLWPALVEKAFLKVRGGYDFPGSNSGTDLWMLTGWIPQHIFLQCDEIVTAQLWKQMFSGFANGDVLITMGTGKISNHLEREIGLAGEHDYAVLDLREKDEQCLLLVKNPWCEGTSWKGSIPPLSEDGHGENGDAFESSKTPDLIDFKSEPPNLFTPENDLRPGTFWIDLQNVMQHFESIYLNWYPGMFNHRQDIHFSWDLSSDELNCGRATGCLIYNPQFLLTTSAGGETAYLLLSRHFRGNEARPSSQEPQSLLESKPQYISLYAFKNGGKRVYLRDGSIHRGPYVDSPQTLLCLELEPNTSYTIVACEQDLKSSAHTFTLSTFSQTPITLSKAIDSYPYHTTIQGSWNKSTAGGNASSESYLQNPQYSLALTRKTSLAIILLSATTDLHIHLKLLHSGQKPSRVKSVVRQDIIVESGDYRQGSALAELSSELDAGTYAIICSTFDAGQVGNFTIRIDSMAQTSIRKLPQEGAGRLRKKLADASFREGTLKVAAPIVPKRHTRLALTAKHKGAFSKPKKTPARSGEGYEYLPEALKSHSLLQMTLEIGRGPMRHILMASSNGQHADAVNGVSTEDVDLFPEMKGAREIWLVLDRMSAPYDAVEEWFEVEMFSDTFDGISVGVWRSWDD
ncbi:cysteine protease PalB [Viridothelium virens]|uniref:Cysteine protease PalB n=1 Tax=Viridothelium virens TaxID=1048519 RepID=A0A6A6GUG8_VIRVR|nr:cysteine protease PalB [Viridothelium virens]